MPTLVCKLPGCSHGAEPKPAQNIDCYMLDVIWCPLESAFIAQITHYKSPIRIRPLVLVDASHYYNIVYGSKASSSLHMSTMEECFQCHTVYVQSSFFFGQSALGEVVFLLITHLFGFINKEE